MVLCVRSIYNFYEEKLSDHLKIMQVFIIKTRCFALIANHNSVYLILRSYCKQNFMATTYILRKGRCNVASDRKKLVCLPSMNKEKSLHMMEKSFS